jgi:hypothetical protein
MPFVPDIFEPAALCVAAFCVTEPFCVEAPFWVVAPYGLLFRVVDPGADGEPFCMPEAPAPVPAAGVFVGESPTVDCIPVAAITGVASNPNAHTDAINPAFAMIEFLPVRLPADDVPATDRDVGRHTDCRPSHPVA